MRVLVEVAERRETEYFFRIRGWLDDPEEKQWVEEFRWGLDVPPQQIKDETKALLLNDHGPHAPAILSWQDTEWEI